MQHPRLLPITRIAIIISMLIAWFALSNHCVIGAVRLDDAPAASECPMHTQSSDKTPAEQKDGLPCCKTLRAVTAAKIGVAANTLDFILKTYFSGATLPEISQPSQPVLALDTGPPDALSFSESVLQRSILAHAPPSIG